MRKEPDVSIVIVSWNVRALLLRCLAALPAAVNGQYSMEVIVVDNASEDGSMAEVRKQFPEVEVLALTDNVLYTAAANEGIKRAKGRHLLLLNPDTVPHPGSIAALIYYADSHPQAGLLGPRLLDEKGNDDLRTGRHYPTPWSEFCDWSGLSRHFPGKPWFTANLRPSYHRNQTASVPLLSGACLLLSEHLPPRLRCLNSFFPMYGEDVDLCRRVQEADFDTVLVAEAVVTHIGGGSSRQCAARAAVMAVDGVQQYFRLWQGRRVARWHRLAMAVVAVLKISAFSLRFRERQRAARQRRLYTAIFRWALGQRER